MKFLVTFRDKKTGEVAKSTQVESETSTGVILKAKVQLVAHDFKFDKKKHEASWIEI